MSWTDEEICTSYRNATNKTKQIAILEELTLRPKAEIRAILRSRGLLNKPVKKVRNKAALQELYENIWHAKFDGLDDATICKKFNCTAAEIKAAGKRHRFSIPSYELAKMISLHSQGKSCTAIGNMLGRSPTTVKRYIDKYGGELHG